MNVGDKAQMLIGWRWLAVVIDLIDEIPHFSGNYIRRFTCHRPNGNVICCGRNSIRSKTPPPTNPQRDERIESETLQTTPSAFN